MKTGFCRHAADPRGDHAQTERLGVAFDPFIVGEETYLATALTAKIIRAGERKTLKTGRRPSS